MSAKKATSTKAAKNSTATEKKALKADKAAATRTVEADLPKRAGKLGALEAAAKLLGEARVPMTCKGMIEAMADKGYWTSPAGKTPAGTLYAAILKEITIKGDESRFEKVERGQFALRGARS